MVSFIPLLFLFAIAPWAERAYSLECYICNSTKYAGCNTIKNCSATERFCTRYTASTVSGFLTMHSCMATCPIAKKKWPQLYMFVCCQADRCNRASGVGCCITLLTAAVLVSLTGALANRGP